MIQSTRSAARGLFTLPQAADARRARHMLSALRILPAHPRQVSRPPRYSDPPALPVTSRLLQKQNHHVSTMAIVGVAQFPLGLVLCVSPAPAFSPQAATGGGAAPGRRTPASYADTACSGVQRFRFDRNAASLSRMHGCSIGKAAARMSDAHARSD